MKENHRFRLREMQPADSPGVSDLIAEDGGMATTYFVVDAFSAMIGYAEFRTVGVVAEADDSGRLAGVATVRFGSCQFNGDLLPFAFLDSLKVAQRYRQQGLGAQLTEWWALRARSEFGDRVLLLSATTTDNVASLRTMGKWCREFTESIELRILRTSARPPATSPGIRVREAVPVEYKDLAQKQNNFYQAYNFYVPVSADGLSEERANSPTNEPLSKHFAAVSESAGIVAGVTVRNKAELMVDQLNLNRMLRAANYFLRLLPHDHKLRDIQLKGLWFAAGHEMAAKQLLDTVRYQYHEKGSIIGLALDPRSPFTKIIRRNRLLPIPQLTMCLRGPTPLDRDRLLCVYGRA